MSKAANLKTGDYVKWNSSGGTAKGRIEHTMKEGVLGIPGSSFSITATEEDPAALIRIYRDGKETETLVGHKFSTLTKISREEALKAASGTNIMTKNFFLDTEFKAYVSDDGDTYITGLASTPDVDRTGDIIESNAWLKGGLESYKKNPVILFNHSYAKPIGKAIEIQTDSEGLRIKAKISRAAGEILDLIKDGVLGAFSVGFRIKDAEYMPETDGFRIKDAELFEISVVSVPANQSAIFSLSKSFESSEEYQNFKQNFMNSGLDGLEEKVNAESSSAPAPREATSVATMEIKKMDSKELEALVASVAEKTAQTLAAAQVEREEKARLAADEAARKVSEEKALSDKISVAVTTGAERLVADIEKRFADKNADLEKIVSDLRNEISDKSAEIMKMRESKRIFSDRADGDWKKAFAKDADDAFILGLVTRKGWHQTSLGRSLIEKVNQHSGVEVSSADFEQTVSTNIERDIQNELILAPLFREIPMTAASLILPILPDAGYAEFTSAQAASGSSPKGNLDPRSNAYGTPYMGVTMTERVLTTKKLISKSYLGNETEEDAILPILPLIRESMVRSHARAIEASILVGNHADGPFGTGGASYDGLISLANTDTHKTQSSTVTYANTVFTAANLLTLRKNMGKYGVRPEDVVYIVNQRTYFELLEDAEFQDMNLVGNLATKINGQVGQIYGSRVMLCDEFAVPAAGKYAAVAVYTRNFIVPRLRGVTIESDYDVENQRRVLVASQRLGFIDIIDGATSKWALQYPAS
jgi:HK97 family phage prohead protease